MTDDLDPQTLARFKRHIATCRPCSQAVRDAREAQSYLQWLSPSGDPPKPAPNFYFQVQGAIEQSRASGWLRNLSAMVARPQLALPLLVLAAGLLLTAWTTMISEPGWVENGIIDLPPARFSSVILSEADRMQSRDLVMVSLVDE